MAKIITTKEALKLVKNKDHIVAGMAASEGREFFMNLHSLHGKVEHVTIDNCLPLYPYEFMINEKYKDTFTVNSWFFSGDLRKAFKNTNISFIPNQLHFAGVRRADHQKPNIFVGNATPPDKHGYVSLSLSNVYEKEMLRHADTVILEINPNLPRTLGDLEVHESEVDYFVKVDYEAPVLPDIEPSEKDVLIGNTLQNILKMGTQSN